jgi:hypothetical protein
VVLALTLALLALAAGEATAQRSPLSIAVTGGVAAPTGSFKLPPAAPADVERGASLGIHFNYRRNARSQVYFGFSQHRFGCPTAECGRQGRYVHTGWEVGTRYHLTGGGVQPWLRLGGVFARVERDFALGESEYGLSDLSAGLEAGVGLAVPLGGRFRLEAGSRYLWLNAGFPREGLLRMRFFVTDLGLDVRF